MFFFLRKGFFFWVVGEVKKNLSFLKESIPQKERRNCHPRSHKKKVDPNYMSDFMNKNENGDCEQKKQSTPEGEYLFLSQGTLTHLSSSNDTYQNKQRYFFILFYFFFE